MMVDGQLLHQFVDGLSEALRNAAARARLLLLLLLQRMRRLLMMAYCIQTLRMSQHNTNIRGIRHQYTTVRDWVTTVTKNLVGLCVDMIENPPIDVF